MQAEAKPASARGGERRSAVWLGLYALAHGGGVIAYVPLITLLLPLKAQAATAGEGLGLLTLLTSLGAIAAGVGNIAAGAWSDRAVARGGARRPFVLAGVGLTLASYAAVYAADGAAAIVAAFVLFQLGLNLLLAPLAAIAADEVPDGQKGLLGGLLGAAYPLGALAGVAVTSRGLDGEAQRLAVIAAMVATGVLPFLLATRHAAPFVGEVAEVRPDAPRAASAFRRVWGARLLIQIAGAVLFSYLLLYFQTLAGRGGPAPDRVAAGVAGLAGVAAIATVPLAILLGWASDRAGMRKPFLLGAAVSAAAGLTGLALAPAWDAAAVAYWLFACACGVFLALQNTYAMQLLPSPNHRGRDLGVYNLTNTLPSLIAPPLALLAVEAGGYRLLFAALAAVCVLSAILTAVTSGRLSEP